jgi:hypothetical protein
MTCDLDVVLEPVGSDSASEVPDDSFAPEGADHGCGSCGSSHGSCGSEVDRQANDGGTTEAARAGCATQSHSGCASCGISRLLATRAGRGIDRPA